MAALGVSAAARAGGGAAGGGTLVVENGAAPDGVAAVTLLIKGTVVGRLSSGSPDLLDTVVLDALDPRGEFSANATGGGLVNTTPVNSTRTKYQGSEFRFRAIDGNYVRITIYGTGINLFAVGQGQVSLQGMPKPSPSSGRYSLNGAPFRPLPPTPTASLQINPPSLSPQNPRQPSTTTTTAVPTACCPPTPSQPTAIPPLTRPLKGANIGVSVMPPPRGTRG